jgi:hypothetical protein
MTAGGDDGHQHHQELLCLQSPVPQSLHWVCTGARAGSVSPRRSAFLEGSGVGKGWGGKVEGMH